MRISLILLCFSVVLFSFSKNDGQNGSAPFTVTNSWQFEMDGRQYSGTVDTSYYIITQPSIYDTGVYVTGSSADGKVNLNLRIFIDRTHNPSTPIQVYPDNSFIS